MIPIARALVEAGADGLCVATLDEAVAPARCRASGRRDRALPDPAGACRARRGARGRGRRGRPGTARGAARGGRAAGRRDRRLDIELEIETGLGRGGVAARRGRRRPRSRSPRARRAPGGRLDATCRPSEDRRSDGRPGRAVRGRARGDRCGRRRRSRAATSPRARACSPAACPSTTPFGPGLMTYGLLPDELPPASLDARRRPRLRPVMSLVARPVRVVDLPAGHGISYGPTFATGRPSRIATLPLGYGDGWPRSLSNRAEALVRGRARPDRRQRRDGRLHGRRDRRSRAAGQRRTTSSSCSARQGDGADHGGGPGAGPHHELVGGRDLDGPPAFAGVRCGVRCARRAYARVRGGPVARIELWNGDICDLEVDAIVNAANLSLWMATGVGGAIKRAGGDSIEFAAVRQAPVPIGGAVVTPAGRARRAVRDPCRLARPRPADERDDHRHRRPQRVRPGPREQRHEHRVPGARDRRRRVPARRGRARDRQSGARRAARIVYDPARDLRDARRHGLSRVRVRAGGNRGRAPRASGTSHELSVRAHARSSATSSSSRSPARSSCAA